METRLVFSAFDTLFFREARPMESVGAKPLEGRFPPTARTMSGVVRSLVGEAMGVDWLAYRDGSTAPEIEKVRKIIGPADGDGIGALKLRGPFPTLDGERLYPAPLHVLHKDGEYVRLKPGDAAHCDLDNVYLPEMEKKLPGAKPLEQCWLKRADIERVLCGAAPREVIEQKELFSAEPRLGIALNRETRSAAEGKLYQTVHARLNDWKQEVGIGIYVDNLPQELFGKIDNTVLRMGGEGRFASVGLAGANLWPVVPDLRAAAVEGCRFPRDARGLLLMLLTPASFVVGQENPSQQKSTWLPPGFTETKDGHGVTVWTGEIAGVELTLQCAVIGKAVREGGWDMKNHRSRHAVNLVPAGSVYFCKVMNGGIGEAAETLQQFMQTNKLHLGLETEMGRGELAVGYW